MRRKKKHVFTRAIKGRVVGGKNVQRELKWKKKAVRKFYDPSSCLFFWLLPIFQRFFPHCGVSHYCPAATPSSLCSYRWGTTAGDTVSISLAWKVWSIHVDVVYPAKVLRRRREFDITTVKCLQGMDFALITPSSSLTLPEPI